MGQKVNPHGLRVGIIKGWDTQWYADKKDFGAYLKEDYDIRKYVKDTYYAAAISKVTIERAAGKIAVTIYTARPGVLIGKAGAEIEVMKKKLAKITNGKPVSVNIFEVKKPDADAQLVAESIAAQLEKRASFRRSMKQAISRSMKSGVKGIKVMDITKIPSDKPLSIVGIVLHIIFLCYVILYFLVHNIPPIYCLCENVTHPDILPKHPYRLP